MPSLSQTILARLIFLVLASLGAPALVEAQDSPVISELVARNDGSLLDEDGVASDWIEIYNPNGTNVDMEGWHLTDDATDLTKWTFPATNLPPKGFMVVFASGRSRETGGQPLHTGFGLNSQGGYLALVHPDGVTVSSEFAPAYPPQHSGFSYGLPQQVEITSLIASKAVTRFFIPTNGAVNQEWVSPSFDDSGWGVGVNGIGYEETTPGWAVRVYKANVLVDTISQAEQVITNSSLQSAVYGENALTLNYFNSGGTGHYPNDQRVPGFGTTDVDDYVIEATGYVAIPAAGKWTFGVSSDDGFKLTVGDFAEACDCLRGPGDTLQTFDFPIAGEYPARVVFFERGGGSEVEVFAVAGAAATWDPSFRLVGDSEQSGLSVRSQPILGSSGGYARLIMTDVQAAMFNKSGSAYVRMPFSIPNGSALSEIALSVRYDDGFVAYLNGTEIARRNAPEVLDWNSTATTNHSGGQSELIYLGDRVGLLHNGQNLLAIQGLNDALNSAAFLIQAELNELKVTPAGTGYRFYKVATPNSPNSEPPSAGFLGDVHFSVKHGFYDVAFPVELSCDDSAAAIYYTTDGSMPSEANGSLYTSPIFVDRTTTLRAGAYKKGYYPAADATASYFFLKDVIRQPERVAPSPAWPVPRVRGTGSQTYDYGMDPTVVNNAAVSQTIAEDLKSIPTFSVVMDLRDLFDAQTGFYANPYGDTIAWERPCSLELVEPDGTPDFQVNCGIRVRGGYSRSPDNPKHGLRFFFRSEYGQGSLKFPLLASQGGAGILQKFDLRTFQNYSWSFDGDSRFTGLRDVFSRDTQLAMGVPATRGEYYHLYLNGTYWGIYNIDERAEANFAASYLGGSSTNYDTIKVSPEDGYVIYATDGDMGAWTRLWMQATNGFSSNANYFKVQGLNPDGTLNPLYENLIDVDNLIDYMLVILYGGNLDAPISSFLGNTSPNNFFAVRDRTGAHGGFRFMAHDSEHTLLDTSANRIGPFPAGSPGTGGLAKSNPQYFWQQMWGNPEFRIKVADHAQKRLFNGGALVASNCLARITVRSNHLAHAINAESARWGNANHSPSYTRSDWLAAVRFIMATFIPGRVPTMVAQLRSKNLFPSISAPVINQFGGKVMGGFGITLSNPNPAGTIYYTLDGTEARLIGGGLNPTASTYVLGASIPLYFQTRFRARVLSGNNWSAEIDPYFYPEQDYAKLAITELMYNPPALGSILSDNLEFLELQNTSQSPLDISGAHFTSGIKFSFPPGTRLSPGQFFLMARDVASFKIKYPAITVDAEYTGKLSNKGDAVTLVDALGGTIFSFSYNNKGQWPITPDGHGFSLVPKDFGLDLNDPASWRASAVHGGSPGREDSPPPPGGVVVNEILANSNPPQTDAIELFNPSNESVNVSHWSLTDDPNTPLKFRIPEGTILAPGEYRVFTETDFNRSPGSPGNFALSADGDQVYLFAVDAGTALTGYSHGFKFSASHGGATIGRYLNSVGAEKFELLAHPTLGATNDQPIVGSVVITRLMYHPLDFGESDNTNDEFIELLNTSPEAVLLFDPASPTNTWRLRGTLTFDFPPNVVLLPGATIQIAHFDPVDPIALRKFRAKFSIAAPVFGPFAVSLGNAGGTVELEQPLPPVAGVVPYMRADRLDYSSSSPWPFAANGMGAALQRIMPRAYGNDPTNWTAQTPLVVWTPPEDASARPGTTIAFSVYATGGGPLMYQWMFNGTNLLNEGPFAGVNSSNLVIANAQSPLAGTYEVMIGDGSVTATSYANLTILVNPTINRPPSSQTIVQGDNAYLTIDVADTATLPITYEWQVQAAPYRTNILGSFSDAIVIANVQSNLNVRVVVKNPASPYPGKTSASAQITVLPDSDGDHMPDFWETQFGLDPRNAADALLDSDHDGMTNLDEFRAGTDPKDASSLLRLTYSFHQGQLFNLQVFAVPNKTYTVQFCSSLDASRAWKTLTNITAQVSGGFVTVRGANVTPGLPTFYRVVSPIQP